MGNAVVLLGDFSERCSLSVNLVLEAVRWELLEGFPEEELMQSKA